MILNDPLGKCPYELKGDSKMSMELLPVILGSLSSVLFIALLIIAVLLKALL